MIVRKRLVKLLGIVGLVVIFVCYGRSVINTDRLVQYEEKYTGPHEKAAVYSKGGHQPAAHLYSIPDERQSQNRSQGQRGDPMYMPMLDPEKACHRKVSSILLLKNEYQPNTLTGNCAKFKHESKLVRRNVTDVFLRDQHPGNVSRDISLVTHLSLDRLDKLQQLLHYWQGPLSVSVCLNVSDIEKEAATLCQQQDILNRDNLQVHVMQRTGDLYPGNSLRNLALGEVNTEFVFLTDIDFLPDRNLYKYSTHLIQSVHWDLKQAFVVPAFEVIANYSAVTSSEVVFPQNKAEVLDLWDRGQIEPFSFSRYEKGHLPTNYSHWRTADEIYQVEWTPQYEPYILTHRKDLPKYRAAFVGRFFNKISHITELNFSGYKFLVMPDVFTIHMPHPRPESERLKVGKECVLQLFRKFRIIMKHMYEPAHDKKERRKKNWH